VGVKRAAFDADAALDAHTECGAAKMREAVTVFEAKAA
jgi:hypothetical protein